ncbi:hemolysin [Philodulcilactobacillus myokoensis]|uniref:Hemolysin n=1 Tax=Philodulcilactobacillus myokoensis TaxID=2929573 RepID=A0A9W6ETP6_9LACO|nr:hemolysin family protein [Philodulcilactobacillus myokoensis]GLB47378.1 hemolysin [Philodulcilactobacillus myokoensis]
MTSGQALIDIIVILITLFFAGFFVACEFALVQTREDTLKEKQRALGHPSKKLSREIHMVNNLNIYLSTTQVGVSLGGIILGWIGETFIVQVLVDLFGVTAGSWMSSATIHSISGIIGVILLTYIEVVLTEILPKNISIDAPTKVLSFVSTPLHYFHKLFFPMVWALNSSAAAVVKMLGIPLAKDSDQAFSQREILDLSKDAVKNGELEKYDYLYMERAFKFNDKVARDIMIDRTQLTTLDINSSVNDAITLYLQSKFSRLPVVKNNNRDNILGYVYNYDLVRQSRVDSKAPIKKLIRDIPTTAESTKITTVLNQMIKSRTPMVVVVDEYGGTSGIITDKDIYEELFGTVRDEIDPSTNKYIFKQPKGTYQVNGKVPTHDFERFFNTTIPAFDKTDIVTIAGFIIDNYSDLHSGKVIRIGNFDFKILKYENSFIDWLEVTPHQDNEQPKNVSKDKEEK